MLSWHTMTVYILMVAPVCQLRPRPEDRVVGLRIMHYSPTILHQFTPRFTEYGSISIETTVPAVAIKVGMCVLAASRQLGEASQGTRLNVLVLRVPITRVIITIGCTIGGKRKVR
ncbi:hypothetical protein BD779DRAFT_1791345 [Infundibulicybe gibba]|nr:hypothetical protein BD779DRAFT_1791345 [Infundibulicybe gibba]